MAGESLETRRRSAGLFGNEKLVEMVLALEGTTPTTAQMLAARTGVAQNLVRAVLLKLERGGILETLPRPGTRSALFFDVPRDQGPWLAVLALCKVVAADAAKDHALPASRAEGSAP